MTGQMLEKKNRKQSTTTNNVNSLYLLEDNMTVRVESEEGNRELKYPSIEETVVVGPPPVSVFVEDTNGHVPLMLNVRKLAHIAEVSEDGPRVLVGAGGAAAEAVLVVGKPRHLEGAVELGEVGHHGRAAVGTVGVGEEVGLAVVRVQRVLTCAKSYAATFHLGVILHQSLGQGKEGDVLVQVIGAVAVHEEAVEHVGELHSFGHLLAERGVEVLGPEGVVSDVDALTRTVGGWVALVPVDEGQGPAGLQVTVLGVRTLVKGETPFRVVHRPQRATVAPPVRVPPPLRSGRCQPPALPPQHSPLLPRGWGVGQGQGRQNVQHRTEPAGAVGPHRCLHDDNDDGDDNSRGENGGFQWRCPGLLDTLPYPPPLRETKPSVVFQ